MTAETPETPQTIAAIPATWTPRQRVECAAYLALNAFYSDGTPPVLADLALAVRVTPETFRRWAERLPEWNRHVKLKLPPMTPRPMPVTIEVPVEVPAEDEEEDAAS